MNQGYYKELGIFLGLVLVAVCLVQCDKAYGGNGKATPHASKWRAAYVTQFGSKSIGDPLRIGVKYDKQAGAVFACLSDRGGIRKMDPMAWGIAARQADLPCGAIVEMCRAKICVTVPVFDRGPYHAIPTWCKPFHSGKCWRAGKTQLRLKPGYRRANRFDLLPRVAWAIRLLGRGWVKYRVIYIPRALRTLKRSKGRD